MTIDYFVRINQLQPGDVLKVQKNIGLADHYIVYLGFTGFEHKFVANMAGRGVDWLEKHEISKYSKEYSLTDIRRFAGSEYQRNQAILRAVRAMKKEAYNLLTNNSEHFANYTQHGVSYSSQAQMAGVGIAVAGLAVTATAKNDAARLFGIFAMIAGGMIALSEQEFNEENI